MSEPTPCEECDRKDHRIAVLERDILRLEIEVKVQKERRGITRMGYLRPPQLGEGG